MTINDEPPILHEVEKDAENEALETNTVVVVNVVPTNDSNNE